MPPIRKPVEQMRWDLTRGLALHGPGGARALTSVTSTILVVVILAGIGVGTYGVLGGFNTGPKTTCSPPNSPICAKLVNVHDVTLLLPLRSIQSGVPAPVTVQLPAGESSSKNVFNFGDGTTVTTANSSTVHTFTSAGTYLLSVQSTVGSLVHDNYPALVQVSVTPTTSPANPGSQPGVQGQLVSNSTAPVGSRQITAVLAPGGSVTLAGSYTTAPTNPEFSLNPPKFNTSAGVTQSNPSLTDVSASGTFSFNSPGNYLVTYVGSASAGNSTAFQNFTWTVFVAAQGVHARVAGLQVHTSPHPGTIIIYELVPGGGLSEDPAIDYETAGAEPIINVYQTLITYNGSRIGPAYTDFVPTLATCVPGSPECAGLYGGDTLVKGWNYTFVLSHNASFYDPRTGASWGVYPSDVVFSISRTAGFSTLPCQACNNGWIIAQSLLSSGNGNWDSIHAIYNNTPQNILGSMSVNETGFCPSSALNDSNSNGCVTFHAYGNNRNWPFFLELIADPLGGSIVPCGWFSATAQGAGIPYWTQNNVSGAGDHPCGMPGTPGYGVDVSQMPATGWDQWEEVGSGSFGYYLGNVQYSMAGSGPYYLYAYQVGNSFTLKANPAWGSNPLCTWKQCQPPAGHYASTVEVTWENQPTPGEEAYAAGIADAASIPGTDFAFLLQLIGQGKVNAISAPSLSIGFYPFVLNFNVASAGRFTTSPVTVPGNWFSYLGMRQLFARAYPYTTIQQTIQTRDGVQLSFDYGGAIPQFMANYYPRDIPWPNSDPCSDASVVACPAYWWAQMHDSTSPYYDPQVASCSSQSPCQLPMFGETGSPSNDQVMALWATQVQQITGGAVKVNPVDITFVNVVINSEFSPAGENPMPTYALGWAPDYPDPTDYTLPLYNPNSTYTQGDAVIQSLLVPDFTNGCTHGTTDYNYYANNSFPQSCQGIAYKAMLFALNLASQQADGPYRVLLYDLGEKIAYWLCLYTYTGQGNIVAHAASWVDTFSFNTNPTLGGGGDTPFYWLTGNGVQGQGST